MEKKILIFGLFGIVLVFLISGCIGVSTSCPLTFAGPYPALNISVKSNEEAYNALNGVMSSGYLRSGDLRYSKTENSTINDIEFTTIKMSDDTIKKAWVLNRDLAIDNNGNVYISGGCA